MNVLFSSGPRRGSSDAFTGLLLIVLVSAMVLNFAWNAEPMISYMAQIDFLNSLEREAALGKDAGSIWAVFSLFFKTAELLLWFLTVAVPVYLFVLRSSGAGKGLGTLLLLSLLALLGWYIGNFFYDAALEKAICEQNGQRFAVCGIHVPLFGYLSYIALLLLTSVSVMAGMIKIMMRGR